MNKYKVGLLIGAGLSTVLTMAQGYLFKQKQLPASKPKPTSRRASSELELEGEPDEEGEASHYEYDDGGTPLLESAEDMSDAEIDSYKTGIFA